MSVSRQSCSRKSFVRTSLVRTGYIGLCAFFSATLHAALPPMNIDLARAELSKRLFFDTRLSGDDSISCSVATYLRMVSPFQNL